jgi:hypothetical protein
MSLRGAKRRSYLHRIRASLCIAPAEQQDTPAPFELELTLDGVSRYPEPGSPVVLAA